jgi:hypothetical protein
MNPILAHPSAKSITLTLSSKCLDPVMMRIATLLLTGQHCASHTVAVRKAGERGCVRRGPAAGRPCQRETVAGQP